MRYEVGTVLNIKDLNKPLPAHVITEDVYEGVTVYSLGKDTDIPVQTNPNYHCFFLLAGKLNVFTRDRLSVLASKEMSTGDGIIVPFGQAAGSTVLEDSVAVEVVLGKKLEDSIVNPMEPFTVRDLIEYKPGQAFQATVFSSGFMCFDIASLDMNTELKDIQAPGELILTGLCGEGTVIYNGEESVLHIGENFRIANGTSYTLKAQDSQFKVSQLSRME